MKPAAEFEDLYREYVQEKAKVLPGIVGDPVMLADDEFQQLLARYRDKMVNYPDLSFWVIFDIKKGEISASGGMEEVFGRNIKSLKELHRTIHPDYLFPYFKWGVAAFQLSTDKKVSLLPLRTSYRVSIPLKTKTGAYQWFSQHVTVTQVDAHGKLVSYLSTYYRDGKWSPHNLRPFEACLHTNLNSDPAIEAKLYHKVAPFILDELTNKELELLKLYATGASGSDVLTQKGLSKYTLHEYNANILKKARKMFQFEFKTAKEFALYCEERGFIVP